MSDIGKAAYEAYADYSKGKSLVSGAPLPAWDEQRAEIRAAWNSAAATITRDLGAALDESLKLQSHYAELLNHYDGGGRKGFPDAEAWIRRLKETGKLPAKPGGQNR